MALARVQREMLDLSKYDIFVFETDYDMLRTRVNFMAPETSPYQGIMIEILIIYPKNYPFKPPKIMFVPPIFHPNISQSGLLKVDSLTSGDWSPATTTRMILFNILSLLHEPYVCTENLPKNDKGKEEVNETNEECENMEALKLWRQSLDDFRQVILASLQ